MIKTKRILLKEADINFDNELLDYITRNKEFLEEWTPNHDEYFYTIEYQRNILQDAMNKQKVDNRYTFYISPKDNTNIIIGKIGIFNIVRGAFQSCHMGYSLDKDYINKGLMSEAVEAVVDYAFNEIHLHRVEANVMPKNPRSIRVLDKCGFVNEGVSKDYLLINGTWEDHIHMVKLNENY